jgi:hypothetical protein
LIRARLRDYLPAVDTMSRNRSKKRRDDLAGDLDILLGDLCTIRGFCGSKGNSGCRARLFSAIIPT